MAPNITRRDQETKIGQLEHMSSYKATRPSMRILELENRCTGNRTVGSNPNPLRSQQQPGMSRALLNLAGLALPVDDAKRLAGPSQVSVWWRAWPDAQPAQL
jgi:hypothetical protein